MKSSAKIVIVLFFLFLAVGFVFNGFAQAGWVQGTIGFIKQIRIDDVTVVYELRLDRTGDTPVYRDIFASDLNEFLAIALTAQANGSTVLLQHETHAAGKGWYGIQVPVPSP